jgi:hypothetical protein
VLLTNNWPYDRAVMAWWDKSGQVATFTVAPLSSQCIRFLATRVTDSVRFVFVIGDTLHPVSGHIAAMYSPWFNPLTGLVPGSPEYRNGAEFWTITAHPDPFGSLTVQYVTVPTAPC